MLENSKDVLLLVSAAAIAAFTFFLCWALYLLIKMLRQGNEAIKKIREKVEAISESLESLKEKIVNSATSISTLGKAAGKVIDFVKERKEKKKRKKEEDEK